MHPSFGAITDQIDRIDARIIGGNICHLPNPIASWIEYLRFDVGTDAVEQLLVVKYIRGHKQHVLAGCRYIKRRQSIEKSLISSGGRFSGLCVGCRRITSREGVLSLVLGGLFGIHDAGGGHSSPVEHDARFERQQ